MRQPQRHDSAWKHVSGGASFIDKLHGPARRLRVCLTLGLALLGVRPLALLGLGLRDAASVFHRSSGPIGFAIGKHRALLRRLLKEHVTDDTRDQPARRVVEHLELSGFAIDDQAQVIRKRPPTHGHGHSPGPSAAPDGGPVTNKASGFQ